MPDQRNIQSVAERLELRLERFPNPLHRRRRWFTLLGGLAPLLLVGAFAARGDHTIFMSEPVAVSHQYFQADCKTCHTTPWQPLLRMASTHPDAKSVDDQACHQCHAQRRDDHHVEALAKGVPACADCHLEHRGALRLTDQSDAKCVKCHEPFARHPQFALLREWPLTGTTNAGEEIVAESTREALLKIAKLQPVDGAAPGTAGTWVDKTALKFSHTGHMAPLAAPWLPGSDPAAAPRTTQLQCADCHQMDSNGETMQPIVYEKHCQQCHPLRFSQSLDVPGGGAPHNDFQQLPHETPEIVRSVMRQRLIDAVRRLADVPAVDPPTRLPNRRPTRAQQEWEWVADELRLLENAIFRVPADGAPTHVSNACLKCHEPGDTADGVSGFSIAPVDIPARWMPHSHFRHDRHLQLACTACHPVVSAEGDAAAAAGGTVVADILMPPLAECQSCHGATRGTRPGFRRARNNCTECHQYHHVHLQAAHHP